MAEPKKRTTRSKRGSRRAHQALKPITLISCPKCKQMIKPHQVCPFCGTYKKEKILDFDKKKKQK